MDHSKVFWCSGLETAKRVLFNPVWSSASGSGILDSGNQLRRLKENVSQFICAQKKMGNLNTARTKDLRILISRKMTRRCIITRAGAGVGVGVLRGGEDSLKIKIIAT